MIRIENYRIGIKTQGRTIIFCCQTFNLTKMRIELVMVFVFITWLSLNAQNRIEWSGDYKLTKDDYLAEAPNTGVQQTVLGKFFVGFQLRNYEIIISQSRERNKSWFRPWKNK